MSVNIIKRILAITIVVAIAMQITACGFGDISKKKIRDIEYTIVPENEIPDEVMKIINEKKETEFKVAYTDPEYTYILVGYGEQKYQGYTINVNKLYETKNSVYVKTTFDGPTEYTNIESKSYPYIVIKIETIDKNIVFDHN